MTFEQLKFRHGAGPDGLAGTGSDQLAAHPVRIDRHVR